jgi:uncharacterized repeat protein (TIGR01451 family)
MLAGLVSAIAVLAMAFGAQGASAAPFSCNAFGYLFQTDTPTSPHLVQQIDLATGEYTELGQTADQVNGVGYNTLDNYFYGSDFDTEQIVKINSDLSLEPVPTPAGVARDLIGDFDEAGHYWVSNNNEIFEVDYAPGSPTYGQLIHTGTLGPLPPTVTNGGADWAWINGSLYMAGLDAARNIHLVQINPQTGVRTDLTPAGLIADNAPGATAFGAVYVDSSGNLYASDNGSGQIFRISTKTLQAIKVSNGPTSGGNDGARCALAPLPTVTVTKTVEGRVRSADQFTVGLINPKGEAVESATTSGTATTASTTDFPASQGKTYTITDAMAAGSPSPISEYVQSIVCTDAAGNPVPTGGTTGNWTLLIAATTYNCNVTNKGQADISVTKQATPSPQVPGGDGTYSLTIKNNGPSTAVNAKLTDPLPSGLAYISADNGCTFASGTVTCLAGDLAAGASKTFTITAAVASSATSCDASAVANHATGSSDTPDPNQSNNSASVCPPVAPQSALEITKVGSAPKVPAGGQVMYTLVVHNKGPSDAHGVTVDDSLPSELSLVSARPSQGSCSGTSCDLGTIVAGGNAQILVTANVAPSAAGKRVTNCATVSGKQAKSSGSDRACAVTDIPPNPQPPQPVSDLKVTKKASKSKVLLGQVLTYRLKVTNLGPDDAPEAKVTDTASMRLKTISAKASQGTCDVGTSLTCDLGTLATGKVATIKVRAKVLRVGSVKNTVSTTTGGKDPEPKNNVDGVRTKVQAKLLLKKTSSARSVDAGDHVTYHLTVTNPMGVAARNVRVCDSFPAGLAYVGSGPKASASKGQVCWRFKALRAGGSKKITVLARALPGAAGNLTNHATATARGIKAKAAAKAQSTVRVAPAPPKPTPVTG